VEDACRVSGAFGTVIGYAEDGVRIWKGIPYAHALDEEHRFSPPVRAEPFREPFEAFSFGDKAPQRRLLRTQFSADCLSLNVWAPKKSEKQYPVLFFIHGGSFIHGSGSDLWYDGRYLARHAGMIVVTMNYRLGILGFSDFSQLDTTFSSNLGLRDVLSALEWVHEHIQHFGGDPARITVAGQSAGGTMVSALYGCSQAQQYAARFIMLSGGPTQLQGADECRQLSQQFLRFSEISSPEDLKTIPFSQLISFQKEFIRASGLGSATFRLAVDGKLVTDYPIPAAASGKGAGVPLLVGTTQEELSFMQFKPLEKSINVEKIISYGLSLETEQTREELSGLYTRIFGSDHDRMMLYTDLLFRMGSIWFAQAASEYADVWMYRFDFETTILKANGLQAFHATDLPYLFGNIDNLLIKPMFILKRDLEHVQTIRDNIQEDIKGFAAEGKLPWKKVTQPSAPARCYDIPTRLVSSVPEQILAAYTRTRYYERSFSSQTNPAPSPNISI
jgi:para-nitrobenzyl esterase